MFDYSIKSYFLGEKISKIRWLPEQLKESDKFLTGCWNEATNYVKIWNFKQDFVPQCIDKIAFNGDITAMEVLNSNMLAVGCSDGRIALVEVKCDLENYSLETCGASKLIHKVEVTGQEKPCTGISIYGDQIASVGEDCHLNIIDINKSLTVYRSIEADNCSLTSVAFVNPQEVLTGNRIGIVRLFDTRCSSDNKSCLHAFMTSCKEERFLNYISCIVSHPTQPHVILAGSEEGSISVYDLRELSKPCSYIDAHSSAITEIGFHCTDPTTLFTASNNGELWKWSEQSKMSDLLGIKNETLKENDKEVYKNPWLNGEYAKLVLDITSIMTDLRKPINSFDTNGTRTICGSDCQAIYLINNKITEM